MKSKLRLFPPEEILILIFDFIEITERLLDLTSLLLSFHISTTSTARPAGLMKRLLRNSRHCVRLLLFLS